MRTARWRAKIAIYGGAMNWLDYVLLIIIGFSVVHGLSHGALRMLTSLLSFALGIYGAWVWHGQAATLAQSHLGTSPLTSEIIGYAAVFVLIFMAVQSLGQRIITLTEVAPLNLLDRLAGAGLGAVLGAIFAGLNIVLLTALLPSNYPLLQNSQLAPKILSYDRELMKYIPPQVKQIYQDKRDQLTRYWDAKHGSPANAPRQTR
jgi:membrane protein required for colicin V production